MHENWRRYKSSAAVKAFLSRSWISWDKYKTMPVMQLDALAKYQGIDQELWSRLFRHQKQMLLIAIYAKRFAWWADMGTGKTLAALALVRHTGLRTLVLVPNRAVKAEWLQEIEKHVPDTSCLALSGSSDDKWHQLQEDRSTIVLETYMGILHMVSRLEPAKKRNRMRPIRQLVHQLVRNFDGLILDESHYVKDRSSLSWRICNQLSKHNQIVIAMSGTPFGRDPTDLWAQMFLVDRGATLGETLGLFRDVFCGEPDVWGQRPFLESKRGLLNHILKNRSVRYIADEADLPEVVEIIKQIPLAADADVYRKRAYETLVAGARSGKWRETKNAFLRLRQISSGFVGYIDDDSGERAQIEFENPKLELLLNLVQSIRDCKAVIFHEFNWSGRRIEEELKHLEIGCLRLYGGTKDIELVLRTFNHDPGVRILILQNRFGSGLNLQIARYGIFFESPVSAIVRQQCRRRIERQGSRHDRIFLYDLVCRGTFDQQILEYVKEGRDLLKEIMDGKIPV